MKAGWVFGDTALLFQSPRSASIVASTAIELWAMDRRTFHKVDRLTSPLILPPPQAPSPPTFLSPPLSRTPILAIPPAPLFLPAVTSPFVSCPLLSLVAYQLGMRCFCYNLSGDTSSAVCLPTSIHFDYMGLHQQILCLSWMDSGMGICSALRRQLELLHIAVT